MRRVQQFLAGLALLGMAVGDASASGVGASYYVPGALAPPATCPTGGCPPVAACGKCQRLGFACVDHATVPPCTVEGGCYPDRESFGFAKTKWRRWPGTEGARGGVPRPADATEDSLLPGYEEPRPEDEDQQAPPPIEDEESPDDGAMGEPRDTFTPGSERPGVEIDLPPLPEGPIPTPRPAAPGFGDGPPSLPFGYAPPQSPGSDDDGWAPPRPPFGSVPTALPNPNGPANAPPAMPHGFTQLQPTKAPRRLPLVQALPATARYDAAVLPASAQLPPANR